MLAIRFTADLPAMRFAYSALFMLLLPLVMLRLLWRSRRAPAYRRRMLERLGIFTPPADSRPVIWIHAVSLGETLAARRLVEQLLEQHSDHLLVMTTTTPTGSEQVTRLFRDRVFHVYAPWDTPGSVKRFLERIRPRLLVLMETELWPNMLHYSRARQCKTVLANARLSARSAAGYARFPRTSRNMFVDLDWVGAQAAADADRFVELGMDRAKVAVTGSIKFDVELDDATREMARELRESWDSSRPTVIVASTHEGEDEIALEAFASLCGEHTDALLLLAPRHPERFDAVYEKAASRDFTVQRRSADEPLASQTQVLLLDTLGELPVLFGTADMAVIGGSFVENGGHNPLEAAAWGLPILSGPSMFNFADVSRLLIEADALQQVTDAASLFRSLQTLLDDRSELQRRGNAALQVVESNRGALQRLYGGIAALLQGENG